MKYTVETLAKERKKIVKYSSYVPVVELDTIKASDAFGSGSSPDGHTKKEEYPSRVFLFFGTISFNVGARGRSRERE